MVECPRCKTSLNAKNAMDSNNLKWDASRMTFAGTCPSCNTPDTAWKVKDISSKEIARMNIIKWKPDDIYINSNPITGESEYFYKIPREIRNRIKLGDSNYVTTVPMGIIEAVKTNKDFKFAKGAIHHMKGLSMGDFVEGFGIPPLLSHYSTVFYMQCLRKANESISLEHMNPLRTIFPQQGAGAGDPIANTNLGNFTSQIKQNMQRFKSDPNHVLIAPIPIGSTTIGGQGKSLLITQELQFAEEQMLMSLGVSRELLSGTTNWTSSAVGLRLLENNLNQYVRKLATFIDWIFEQISGYLSIDKVEVSLVPFGTY